MRTFAILPAAGRSTRFGRPKLLLPWNNSTVIEHVLAVWRASLVERTIVVTHPGDTELARECADAGAKVVRASAATMDMKASVRLGLAHLRELYRPGSTDAWLLAPADMPLLEPEIINTLINHHLAAGERIQVPTFAARRGHPIVLPWSLAGVVLDPSGIPPDRGIDALVEMAPVEEVAIQTPAVIEDMDTTADYERLLALSRGTQQEVPRPGE